MEAGLTLRCFMQLSHPINGGTPEGHLSLSKHLYLSTAWSTHLCADSYSKLQLYHPGVAGTTSCSPIETSLSFKIHNVTNKRKSDFDTGCLLKNQICSFRYPHLSGSLIAQLWQSICWPAQVEEEHLTSPSLPYS